MARLMHEFFRPRLSQGVVYPIGVIAQDDDGVVYRAIAGVELPEDVDQAFYGLATREAFMNDDFLPRLAQALPVDGGTLAVDPGDERLLGELAHRGTHHFVYGPIECEDGSADEVAGAEAARLTDKGERRDLVLRMGDPTTRAVLQAYG